MPDTVRGLFGSKDYEAGIKKLDIRDKIYELQPDVTPFITVLGKMSKFRAVDNEFKWFEDDLLGNYTKINCAAGYAAGITILVVDDASIFQVNDVVKDLTTEECMLITGIDDTNNKITVRRGWGTTEAAAIADNEYIYKLGSAMQEGYTAPESLITAKTPKTNFLQTFSKTVMLTQRAQNIDTYGGNRRNFERNKKGVELKREMESQLIWGEPKEDTTGSQPIWQTGGVYYFITSNAPELDMSGAALTESAFEGWLKDVFLYSGEDRVLFCGPLVASQISQFAAGKQRVEAGTTIKYGIKVRTYHSTMGDIHIAVDRHFIGPHAGKGLCLKVNELIYRYMQNMDWALDRDIQKKEDHFSKDEYSVTCGLELHHDLLHGTMKGVE